MGSNPAFTAALIAQESAFDPKSGELSAGEMGLTQVTPVAEEEVEAAFSAAGRATRAATSIPPRSSSYLVMSGEINASNEWRLNPERSIRGGLLFAQKLADRWLDSDELLQDQLGRGRWAAWLIRATDAEVAAHPSDPCQLQLRLRASDRRRSATSGPGWL